MKTLTLHVGTHKTGTSSLQRFLFENADRLAERGYDYPIDGVCYRPHSGHSPLAHALAGTRPGWWPADAPIPSRAEATRAIRQRLSGSELAHGILSSEHFFTHITPARLHEAVVGVADTLRVIVFLRPQEEFLASRYAQLTRVGWHARSLEEFVSAELEDHRGYCYYHHALSALAEVFGREQVQVRTFSGAQPRARLFADFLGAIGLQLEPAFSLPEARNVSPPAALIRVMATIQRHVDAPQPRRAALNRRLARAWVAAESQPRQRLIGSARARAIRAHFGPDNARVAGEFLGRSKLFEPIPAGDWPAAAEPSPEALVELGLSLWSEMRAEMRAINGDIRRLTAAREAAGSEEIARG